MEQIQPLAEWENLKAVKIVSIMQAMTDSDSAEERVLRDLELLRTDFESIFACIEVMDKIAQSGELKNKDKHLKFLISLIKTCIIINSSSKALDFVEIEKRIGIFMMKYCSSIGTDLSAYMADLLAYIIRIRWNESGTKILSSIYDNVLEPFDPKYEDSILITCASVTLAITEMFNTHPKYIEYDMDYISIYETRASFEQDYLFNIYKILLFTANKCITRSEYINDLARFKNGNMGYVLKCCIESISLILSWKFCPVRNGCESLILFYQSGSPKESYPYPDWARELYMYKRALDLTSQVYSHGLKNNVDCRFEIGIFAEIIIGLKSILRNCGVPKRNISDEYINFFLIRIVDLINDTLYAFATFGPKVELINIIDDISPIYQNILGMFSLEKLVQMEQFVNSVEAISNVTTFLLEMNIDNCEIMDSRMNAVKEYLNIWGMICQYYLDVKFGFENNDGVPEYLFDLIPKISNHFYIRFVCTYLKCPISNIIYGKVISSGAKYDIIPNMSSMARINIVDTSNIIIIYIEKIFGLIKVERFAQKDQVDTLMLLSAFLFSIFVTIDDDSYPEMYSEVVFSLSKNEEVSKIILKSISFIIDAIEIEGNLKIKTQLFPVISFLLYVCGKLNSAILILETEDDRRENGSFQNPKSELRIRSINILTKVLNMLSEYSLTDETIAKNMYFVMSTLSKSMNRISEVFEENFPFDQLVDYLSEHIVLAKSKCWRYLSAGILSLLPHKSIFKTDKNSHTSSHIMGFLFNLTKMQDFYQKLGMIDFSNMTFDFVNEKNISEFYVIYQKVIPLIKDFFVITRIKTNSRKKSMKLVLNLINTGNTVSDKNLREELIRPALNVIFEFYMVFFIPNRDYINDEPEAFCEVQQALDILNLLSSKTLNDRPDHIRRLCEAEELYCDVLYLFDLTFNAICTIDAEDFLPFPDVCSSLITSLCNSLFIFPKEVLSWSNKRFIKFTEFLSVCIFDEYYLNEGIEALRMLSEFTFNILDMKDQNKKIIYMEAMLNVLYAFLEKLPFNEKCILYVSIILLACTKVLGIDRLNSLEYRYIQKYGNQKIHSQSLEGFTKGLIQLKSILQNALSINVPLNQALRDPDYLHQIRPNEFTFIFMCTIKRLIGPGPLE